MTRRTKADNIFIQYVRYGINNAFSKKTLY